MMSQEHDLESLRVVTLEIGNAHVSLHALTMKFRVLFQLEKEKHEANEVEDAASPF
jgi:hypothetical protein